MAIWRDRVVPALALRAVAYSNRRPPDVLIGGDEEPYMRRWWLIRRNRFFNIYLHHFLRSDNDEALHDHPWWNVSLLLTNSYVEHTIEAGGIEAHAVRKAGDVKIRGAKAAHRIELKSGPCWTIFITGPVVREWGFHCAKAGWRHWKDFVKMTKGGNERGRGCGEADL